MQTMRENPYPAPKGVWGVPATPLMMGRIPLPPTMPWTLTMA